MHKQRSKGNPFSHCVLAAAVAAALYGAGSVASAAPTGGTVVGGQAQIGAPVNGAMTIEQSSQRAAINWLGFSIAAGESVRFNQPSASAIALNRVLGQDPSQILGSLSANGQVFILNPNGVLFGRGAQVNVGGIVASTLDLSPQDFMNGSLTLAKAATAGSVVNQGTITAAEGGYVALLGPQVRNEGVIAARLGTVALAAGEQATLNINGNSLLSLTVDRGAVEALAENKNLIRADGGRVLMTAKAADSLIRSVVNNEGVIEAGTLVEKNGVIRLEGGRVTNTGTLRADGDAVQDGGMVGIAGGFVGLGGTVSAEGANGGTIEVSSLGGLSLAENVSARGLAGAGGGVSYRAGGTLIESVTSRTDVSGAGDGGAIRVQADGGLLSSGTYLAAGAGGRGGLIDLSGDSVRLLSAQLDASGMAQGGRVRVGGAFQGGKSPDPAQPYTESFVTRWDGAPIASAARTFVNDGARIDVSSAGGAGGTAIVWSETETTMLGAIDARGALAGGAVEISSKETLRHASLDRVQPGAGGQLLLDPKNIVIGDAASVSSWSLQAVLGSGYAPGRNANVALNTGDNFGFAVALNAAGDRLAVGAPGDNGAGNSGADAGAVHLFSFSDTAFSGGALAGTLGAGYTGGRNVNVALDAGDQFGSAVALNAAGDRLAVGALGDDGAGNGVTNAGAVHLFSFSDTAFSGGTLAGTIGVGYTGGRNVNVALDAGDQFGSAVALNAAGDRLAVGAFQDAGAGNGFNIAGAVHLFTFSDTAFSGGALAGTLGAGYTGGRNVDVALDGPDNFGSAVALNAAGDRLAVGALGDRGVGNGLTNAGAVYLFTFSDTAFSGGTLAGTLGSGYTGGKNVNVALGGSDNFGSAVALNAAGDRLAVGTPFDDGAGNAVTDAGAVYLFTFSDTAFSGGTLAGTIGTGYTGGRNVNVALNVSDHFGRAVALNAAGDRLAVGAPLDDGVGNGVANAGAVHLFTFSDTAFSGGALAGTLGTGYTGGRNVNVALDANDQFGAAVALNAAGDRLAVGAPFDGGAGNANNLSGAVHLFTFSGTAFSGGTLAGTLGAGYTGGRNVNVALDGSDLFGSAVALNAAGDRLAVGARLDDGAGNGVADAGAVHLFTFSDTAFSGGALAGTLGAGYTGGRNVNVALEAADQFGGAVALNAAGDRLAVGARGDDGSGNANSGSGAVHLFTFTDTSFSGGTLAATLGSGYTGGNNVDVALEAGDSFGSAVALNAAGDRLAVGAPLDDGAGNANSNSGAVHLFTFTNTSFSGGALAATLGSGYTGSQNVNVALDANDFFGFAVALNAAGDRLAVGAPFDDGAGNGVNAAGAVHLFTFSNTAFSGGTLAGTIGTGYTGGRNVDVALEAPDQFGSAVALNAAGDRLAVGAPFDDGAGNGVADAGAVHLFSFSDTAFSGGALAGTIGAGYTGGRNVNVALDVSDQFGGAVALNAAGDRLAVGAIFDRGASNGVAAAGAVHLFSFSDTAFSGGTLAGTIGAGYTGGRNVNIALDVADQFGGAVALNAAGDRLAVGALGDDGSGNGISGSGAVHLFSFSDTAFSGGTLAGTLGAGYTGGKNVNVALDAGDLFGSAVALNAAGDRLAVGALGDDGAGNGVGDSGAVYLFSFSDTAFSGGALAGTLGAGYTGGKNVNVALDASDQFGSAVALNAAGDRLAVGARLDDGAGNGVADAGAVHLFSFSDTAFSGGALAGTLGAGYTGGRNVNVALDANDQFGAAVALNAAGDRLAVGAAFDDGAGNGVTNAGAVHLFSFTDTAFSGGTLAGTLGAGYTGGRNVNVALEAGDSFGSAVALNAAGDRLAVGAAGDRGAGNGVNGSGAVYLFAGVPETGFYPAQGYSWSAFADQSITVSRSSIEQLLGTGAALTLQASNDITLAAALNVNNPGGNGGALTLQAGRSILLDAGIATDNGNVTLIANDRLANGVVDAQRDAGAAVIAMAPGTFINAGTGTVAIELRDGAGKTNAASGDITLRSITAGTISAVNNGPTAGSDIVIETGATLAASGTGDALVLAAASGGDFVNNAGAGALSAPNGRWLVYSASPAGSFENGLTAAAGGAISRLYGMTYAGNAPATLATGNHLIYGFQPTLTVTADDKTRVYGDANPPFTATISGFLTDDGVTDDAASAGLTGTAGLASAAVANSPVAGGPYAITAAAGSLASGAGYAFAFAGGQLTVDQRPVTVTASAGQTKVYGNADPASYTFANSSLGAGVALAGALDRAAGENVGGYAIGQGTLTGANNPNYSLTYAGDSFGITQRPVTVTANAGQTKVYGNADPALIYSITTGNLVGADTLAGALERAAGENVGNYAINQGTLGNPNYAITYAGDNFGITQRPVTVTASAGQTKVYGNADPASYTFANSSLGAGVALAGALDRAAGENVGGYAIGQGTLTGANNPNYSLTYVGDNFGITLRPLSIAADNLGRGVGERNPPFTATFAGFAFADGPGSLAGTLSFATPALATSPPGSYAITLGGLSSSNYAISFVPGELAVGVPARDELSGIRASIYKVGQAALKELEARGQMVSIEGSGIRLPDGIAQ